MSSSWLEELEARLDQQLEAFLRANPRQEELLAAQQAQERQRQLRQRRRQLQEQAQASRRQLLQLAEEIRRWQVRTHKARSAGAPELADQAEAHIAALMEQGRQAWQQLAELAERFQAVEAELQALARAPGGQPGAQTGAGSAQGQPAPGSQRSARQGAPRRPAGPDAPGAPGAPGAAQAASEGAGSEDLEARWAAFETRLELEQLRQRLQP